MIPNFLDCQTYRRQDLASLRHRYAGPDERTRIVIHVSNFRPVKRIDSVMEIFARIAARVPARLLLVGDGPELATARRMARDLDVADRVQSLGSQENVIPLLSIADLFLLPSAQESFGLAALEAMACGVPVVASNAGGLPEVIDDGVTGFLHPIGDVDAMAASGLLLLSDDDLARAHRGRGGGQRAPALLRGPRRSDVRSALRAGARQLFVSLARPFSCVSEQDEVFQQSVEFVGCAGPDPRGLRRRNHRCRC